MDPIIKITKNAFEQQFGGSGGVVQKENKTWTLHILYDEDHDDSYYSCGILLLVI